MEILASLKSQLELERIFARLHVYSNTKRVLGCIVSDFSVLILAYL